MLLEILKAFIIGICASAPLGPVAILVLQKSICYGHKAGFTTGLGASLVDTAYAMRSSRFSHGPSRRISSTPTNQSYS